MVLNEPVFFSKKGFSNTFNSCVTKLGCEKGILMVLGTYRRICFGRSPKCDGMVNLHCVKKEYPHCFTYGRFDIWGLLQAQ